MADTEISSDYPRDPNGLGAEHAAHKAKAEAFAAKFWERVETEAATLLQGNQGSWRDLAPEQQKQLLQTQLLDNKTRLDSQEILNNFNNELSELNNTPAIGEITSVTRTDLPENKIEATNELESAAAETIAMLSELEREVGAIRREIATLGDVVPDLAHALNGLDSQLTEIQQLKAMISSVGSKPTAGDIAQLRQRVAQVQTGLANSVSDAKDDLSIAGTEMKMDNISSKSNYKQIDSYYSRRFPQYEEETRRDVIAALSRELSGAHDLPTAFRDQIFRHVADYVERDPIGKTGDEMFRRIPAAQQAEILQKSKATSDMLEEMLRNPAYSDIHETLRMLQRNAGRQFNGELLFQGDIGELVEELYTGKIDQERFLQEGFSHDGKPGKFDYVGAGERISACQSWANLSPEARQLLARQYGIADPDNVTELELTRIIENTDASAFNTNEGKAAFYEFQGALKHTQTGFNQIGLTLEAFQKPELKQEILRAFSSDLPASERIALMNRIRGSIGMGDMSSEESAKMTQFLSSEWGARQTQEVFGALQRGDMEAVQNKIGQIGAQAGRLEILSAQFAIENGRQPTPQELSTYKPNLSEAQQKEYLAKQEAAYAGMGNYTSTGGSDIMAASDLTGRLTLSQTLILERSQQSISGIGKSLTELYHSVGNVIPDTIDKIYTLTGFTTSAIAGTSVTGQTAGSDRLAVSITGPLMGQMEPSLLTPDAANGNMVDPLTGTPWGLRKPSELASDIYAASLAAATNVTAQLQEIAQRSGTVAANAASVATESPDAAASASSPDKATPANAEAKATPTPAEPGAKAATATDAEKPKADGNVAAVAESDAAKEAAKGTGAEGTGKEAPKDQQVVAAATPAKEKTPEQQALAAGA